MSEGYTVGGDTLYEIIPPALIGQTFSPLHAHKLEYIDINAEVHTQGGNLYATLHDLADDPNMIGGGISRSRRTDWPPRWWFQISRIRFIMKKVNIKVGHTYGILIHSEPAPWWNKHRVQYDRWDATYPRGRRFTKANWAAAPVYFDDDDLIFVEFGEPPPPPPIPEPPPPPPPPPPDPPVDYWYIRGSEQLRTDTGEIIWIWTDVPCHLWMRWTTVKPLTHEIPVLRRGLYLHADVRICLVVYEDNEQEEAGDTILHTFVKEPWPFCEKRWFMFLGTVDGKEVPSTSGLFSKHPKAPLFIPACYSGPVDAPGYPLRNDMERSFDIIPTRTYSTSKLSIGLCRCRDEDPPTGVYFHIWHADANGKPIGDPLARGSVACELPPEGHHELFTVTFPPITLVEGNMYAISAFGIPLKDGTPLHRFRAGEGWPDTCLGEQRGYWRWWVTDHWSEWEEIWPVGPWRYELPEG